ncbi:MAG: sugar fermentation stimulation protein A [Planctomycetota bacterium]
MPYGLYRGFDRRSYVLCKVRIRGAITQDNRRNVEDAVLHLGIEGDDFLRGVLLERYKRFFADCQLDSGELVTAHCPNTGSMKTLLAKNSPVWLKTHDNPKRKLPYTLTLLGVGDDDWALINTALPNHIVAEGITAGISPSLLGYKSMRAEVPYGSRRSRIDLLLADRDSEFGTDQLCYVEVKNVTMASASVSKRSDFPDSRTERGLKHLKELSDMVAEGHRCIQFYLLGRTDCDSIGVAEEIDPKYAEGLRRAMASGVEVVCHKLKVASGEATLGDVCPFEFE